MPGVPYPGFDCRCGSPLCRGRVTDSDWRIPELQERYDGWFSWYLQRRIVRLRRASDRNPGVFEKKCKTGDSREKKGSANTFCFSLLPYYSTSRNMVPRICQLPPNRSFFLFGPRQTGKSTLVSAAFRNNIWTRDLLLGEQYLQYSKYPELFRREALEKIEQEGIERIFIDEIQRVPLLLNEIHYLIERTDCQFLLTGSSARKLRRGGVNLLGGRAVQRQLFPFVYSEISSSFSLEQVLRFGSLPGVYGREPEVMIDILRAYTETYLKEEVQFEGLVRNLGNFSRFLDLAASQSGELVSYTTIGRECQVATRTVQSFFDILEDTLIAFRMNPWRKSCANGWSPTRSTIFLI